jgi:Ca2+-binding EF-hand superfamily protein
MDRILDDNERKLIDTIKAHVESKNLTAKLVIEFKKRDTRETKMLVLTDMQSAIKGIDLTLAAKQYDELFRIIRPNSEGKYSYMELLTLLFGQFAAQQLGR